MDNKTDVTTAKGLANRDVASGLFLLALGAFALWMTLGLPRGTARQFGPGMMPQAVSVLIMLVGAIIVATSWRAVGAALERWNLRAILTVLGAVVAFGMTIRGFDLPGGAKIPALGMIVSVPLAMMIAALADAGTKWGETLLFAVVLTAFCVGLFKYALGLPIPLAPFLLGY